MALLFPLSMGSPLFLQDIYIDMWRKLRKDYLPPTFFRDISQDDLLSMSKSHQGVGHDAHGHTWLALMQGKKMWFLGPPNIPRPMDPQCDYDTDIEVDYGTYQCVQQEGDIVYFPEMWWHATCNLEDFTVGIGAQNTIFGWNMQTGDALFAAQRGELETLKELLKKGVPMRQGKLQVQPIHLAAFQGNFDCMVWLAENGGGLMSRDEKGQLPIHYATLGGHIQMVRAMLEHGVPLNAVNGNGETLLHISAKFGALEMTKMLLDFGADVNAKDRHASRSAVAKSKFDCRNFVSFR